MDRVVKAGTQVTFVGDDNEYLNFKNGKDYWVLKSAPNGNFLVEGDSGKEVYIFQDGFNDFKLKEEINYEQ
ncbi:hypothetical protein ACFVRU_40170 [Streptomyces sp. NPDC057927]